LAAPKSMKQSGPTSGGLATHAPSLASGGAAKFYGRDLREYDDKDIEGLLSNLSMEELEDLNNDFDPDVINDFLWGFFLKEFIFKLKL